MRDNPSIVNLAQADGESQPMLGVALEVPLTAGDRAKSRIAHGDGDGAIAILGPLVDRTHDPRLTDLAVEAVRTEVKERIERGDSGQPGEAVVRVALEDLVAQLKGRKEVLPVSRSYLNLFRQI